MSASISGAPGHVPVSMVLARSSASDAVAEVDGEDGALYCLELAYASGQI